MRNRTGAAVANCAHGSMWIKRAAGLPATARCRSARIRPVPPRAPCGLRGRSERGRRWCGHRIESRWRRSGRTPTSKVERGLGGLKNGGRGAGLREAHPKCRGNGGLRGLTLVAQAQALTSLPPHAHLAYAPALSSSLGWCRPRGSACLGPPPKCLGPIPTHLGTFSSREPCVSRRIASCCSAAAVRWPGTPSLAPPPHGIQRPGRDGLHTHRPLCTIGEMDFVPPPPLGYITLKAGMERA